MIFGIRKLISPRLIEKIVSSLPYRLYSRYKLINPEIRFSVELTTKCNARCMMCTRQRLVDKKCLEIGEMSSEILGKVFAEMDKFIEKGHRVVFTPMGLGEPLMHSGLFNLIKTIKNKQVKVILVTNGILLNQKNIDNILLNKVDEVSISLNCKDKKSYKTMNGVDTYDVVVSNIKNLLMSKKKLKDNKTNVFIQYLGEDVSAFDKEIVKWNMLMQGGDKCYVHRIVNQAGLANNNRTDVNFPCNQPLFRITIKMSGDMYPCDPALYSGGGKFKELYLGNILKVSAFDQFYDKNSKRYKIMKKMKKEDYKNLECCKVCSTKALAANCFFNTGKINPYGYKWI